MDQLDIDELKRVLTATEPGRREAPPFHRVSSLSAPAQATTLRQSVEQLLKSFGTKAGLDVEKLDQMLRQIQHEEENAFAKQVAELAKQSSWNATTLRHGIEEKRKAHELLNTSRIIPPLVPTRIVLDKPFMIWGPPPTVDRTAVESNIESMHSSLKFRIDTNKGGGAAEYAFYFFWRNDNDFPVVVNVDTSLILTGFCQAKAGRGIFSGDACFLQIYSELLLLEWWDQTNGLPAQPVPESSQMKYVVQFSSSAGGLGSPPDNKYEHFFSAPFDLSYTLFTIPGKSVAVFYVHLNLSYNFTRGGGDINDRIAVDFKSPQGNYSVICPSVNVDILTGPPPRVQI